MATCSRLDPALLGRVEHAPLDVIRELAPELGEHSAWVGYGARASDIRYLVIPPRPASSAGMSEEQLTALVTRESMIGVAQPTTPAPTPAYSNCPFGERQPPTPPRSSTIG